MDALPPLFPLWKLANGAGALSRAGGRPRWIRSCKKSWLGRQGLRD